MKASREFIDNMTKINRLFLCIFLTSFLLIFYSDRDSVNASNLLADNKNSEQNHCRNYQKIAENLAISYLSKTPTIHNYNLSESEALTIQQEFIKLLRKQLGKPIGYKVALTSKTAQERLGVSQPLPGIFLRKMLLLSGSKVAANFGARPMFEGDLMVRVKSKKINQATTYQEVLASLDLVIPFLELPDLVYSQKAKLNASALLAINAGDRLGVVGKPIAIAATPEWEERLQNIQVVISDQTGKELATGSSKTLLGHPLEVVLWLKNDLQRQGKRLRRGDLISLGSITSLMPVESGTTIRAQYLGLDPDPDNPAEVSVTFE